ncbi:MAG: ATP-binding protein [Desulfotignum sp.]|nr:ATP-binding protein [Desulfotignum sp.]MCF8126856.1 ATP-binding protein [Desulfotignum sp.]
MPKVIAYSGAQGTGKTTSAYNHARELKITNPDKSVVTLCDLEAFCPFSINQGTTEEAQAWIFANQIRQELTAIHRFDLVVTDRTVLDVIAYTRVAGFTSLAAGMMAYAAHHVPHHYLQIYFKQSKNNQHCHQDGIRDVDQGFRQAIEDVLVEIYRELLDSAVYPGRLYHV